MDILFYGQLFYHHISGNDSLPYIITHSDHFLIHILIVMGLGWRLIENVLKRRKKSDGLFQVVLVPS